MELKKVCSELDKCFGVEEGTIEPWVVYCIQFHNRMAFKRILEGEWTYSFSDDHATLVKYRNNPKGELQKSLRILVRRSLARIVDVESAKEGGCDVESDPEGRGKYIKKDAPAFDLEYV